MSMLLTTARALSSPTTPGTPEWEGLRVGRVGGSDAAALIGRSRWESWFSLWHRRAGNLAPVEGNPAMLVGSIVESAIADWWATQHPDLAARFTGTWVHPARPWQMANPDRLVTRARGRRVRAVLECKYVLMDDTHAWGEPGTDQIPPWYAPQVQHYLDVFDLDTAYVAALMPGRFAEYVVHPDPGLQAEMRAAGARFLQALAAGNAPDVDEHAATYAAVRDMHPSIDGTTVQVDPVAHALYTRTARDAERAATAHRGIKAVILHQLGDARYGAVGDDRVVRRQPASGGIALHQVKRKARTA